MNPQVIRVLAKPNYLLALWFENGEQRVFDAKPYLERGVFAWLKHPGMFATARVVAGSVEWSCGVDLSYDTLYLESR